MNLNYIYKTRSYPISKYIPFIFNVFHPEVFDTYIYTKQLCSVKHNDNLVCYLLTLGTLGDMFRFTWNHNQALFKNIYPLHIIINPYPANVENIVSS